MTGITHGAIRTSASTGGLPFLFITNHTNDNRRNRSNQHYANNDCSNVFRNPCKHFNYLLFKKMLFYINCSCQLSCLLVRLKEHIQHESEYGYCEY